MRRGRWTTCPSDGVPNRAGAGAEVGEPIGVQQEAVGSVEVDAGGRLVGFEQRLCQRHSELGELVGGGAIQLAQIEGPREGSRRRNGLTEIEGGAAVLREPRDEFGVVLAQVCLGEGETSFEGVERIGAPVQSAEGEGDVVVIAGSLQIRRLRDPGVPNLLQSDERGGVVTCGEIGQPEGATTTNPGRCP